MASDQESSESPTSSVDLSDADIQMEPRSADLVSEPEHMSFDFRKYQTEQFERAFFDAWKAIERGSLERLRDSVVTMSQTYTAEDENSHSFLDVCYCQSTMSWHYEKKTYYYMSLLSHAAVRKQWKILECLIEKGANPKSGTDNIHTGTPLTQILIYCRHFGCPEVIDPDVFQHLLLEYTEQELNIHIASFLPLDQSELPWKRSFLELPIDLKRFDIARMLVKKGADPIDSQGVNGQGVVALMEEYYQFGTNHYLKWLLQEHIPLGKIPDFIERVMNANIFNEEAKGIFKRARRHHAHALLICGNEDMARALIKHPNYGGSELLVAKDDTGKTALQIAAELGDLESVQTLLLLREEYNCTNTTDIALALLAAAREHRAEIVRWILFHDPEVLWTVVPPSSKAVWEQAITGSMSTLFEVIGQEAAEIWLKEINARDGNTLGHIAALKNDPNLFKVVFPIKKQGHKMFEPLQKRNNQFKTPLQLAVEKDYVFILKTLDDRKKRRKLCPNEEHNKEEAEWNEFWQDEGPNLLLLACRCGSLESVKFLINSMECLESFERNEDLSVPLSCASQNGNDEVVSYLLNRIHTVPETKKNQPSPLLLAAANGHRRCVRMLLTHGADVHETDEKGYNCLMKAIEKRHRGAVLTILSDEKNGLRALQFHCIQETEYPILKLLKISSPVKEYTTPMRMLIEYMPDVAEYVLNRCALAQTVLRSKDEIDSGLNWQEMTLYDSFSVSLNSQRFSKLINDDDISFQEVKEILYVKSISVKGAKYLKRRLLVGDLIVKLNSRQITRQEQLKALIQTSHETEFGEATVAAQQEPETPQTSKIMLFIRRKKAESSQVEVGYKLKDKYELLNETWEDSPLKKGSKLAKRKLHIDMVATFFKNKIMSTGDLEGSLKKNTNESKDGCSIPLQPTSESTMTTTVPSGYSSVETGIDEVDAPDIARWTHRPDHPIQLMVKHKTLDLLTHPLINKWIEKHWIRVGRPGQVLYMCVYLMFLILLTTFAVLTPRPNPVYGCCCTNSSVEIRNISNTTQYTDSLVTCQELSVHSERFLLSGAIIIIMFALFYLFLELYQTILRPQRYFKEIENYVQLTMFPLCIVFVFPVGHECWCLSSLRWQLGAVAVFLAWLNLILLIRYLPWIGGPAIQLINVYINFATLVYLPILLIISFAIPFHMLLIKMVATEAATNTSATSLEAYSSPGLSIQKVFLQTVGELDAQSILMTPRALLHPVTSYIIFILFIIAVPILFNNFLIGMAVGETEEERKKAKFTQIKAKVNAIFEIEGTIHGVIIESLLVYILIPIVYYCSCCLCCNCCVLLRKKSKKDELKKVERMTEQHNKMKESVSTWINDIKSKSSIKDTRQKVMKLTKDMSECQETLCLIQANTEKRLSEIQEQNEEIMKQNKKLVEKQEKLYEKIVEMISDITVPRTEI